MPLYVHGYWLVCEPILIIPLPHFLCLTVGLWGPEVWEVWGWCHLVICRETVSIQILPISVLHSRCRCVSILAYVDLFTVGGNWCSWGSKEVCSRIWICPKHCPEKISWGSHFVCAWGERPWTGTKNNRGECKTCGCHQPIAVSIQVLMLWTCNAAFELI